MKLYLQLIFMLSISFSFAQHTKENLSKAEIIKEYQTNDGTIIKAGDKVNIALPSAGHQFIYITQGGIPCGTIIANQSYTIDKIRVLGNKKRGFKAFALFKGFGLSCYVEIETALMVGEVTFTNSNQ